MKTKEPRIERDNYPTPSELAWWGVMRAVELHGGDTKKLRLLEPGCGDNAPFLWGAMKTGVGKGFGFDVRNVLPSLACHERCQILTGDDGMDFLESKRADLLKWATVRQGFDVIMANPPYKLAEEFIWKSLDVLSPVGVAGFLLKLDFLGSSGRTKLYDERPPFLLSVIRSRPSFVYGQTDMHNYGFFYWAGEALARFNHSGTRIEWVPKEDVKELVNHPSEGP